MATIPTRIRGAVLRTLDASSPYEASKPLSVEEVDIDPPLGRELFIRIEAASVCHSDLSVVQGVRSRPVPMLLGHESAGIVEALGPDASQFEVGDRVIMTFLPRCGVCPECKTGGRLPCAEGTKSNEQGVLIGGGMRLHRGDEAISHHLGVSGFATHTVVDERSVVRVGHDVPADVAAVIGCAVLTGGGAVLNTRDLPPKSTVFVVGLGGVGMAAVLVAAASGHNVIGVDGVVSKQLLAKELGAVHSLSPEEALAANERGLLVVDATGNPRGFETAVELTSPGGTTVTVGLPSPEAISEISPLKLVSQARTIVGSYLGSAVPQRDIPIFVEMWRQGKLPVERLISSSLPLDDINVAMDRLASGAELRQVIRFD